MAVVSVKEVADGVRLGLWRFDESPGELASLHPDLKALYDELHTRYRHEGRIIERMAVHALLMAMDGLSPSRRLPVIGHDEAGKPLLDDGRYLSVSHTKGYAALMLSDNHPVGVDIEYVSDRVGKIAHMFLRDDERFSSINGQLVVWCAKEAAYKLFSADKLTFSEMKVEPFDLSACGKVMLTNIKRQVSIPLSYQINQDYVLVYASQ